MTGLAAFGLLAGTANAQLSGDVVRLGVLNDQSGLYADIGGQGSVTAARMAVEDFGGTVLGKPIEIIFADHQNKPDVGSNITRQWIDQDGVDVIVDVPTSSVALAVQAITKEKERIFLMSGPASSDLTGKACSPFGFQWTYDTYALANGTGGAMVKQGGDSWFFLTSDYAFGHALERDTSNAVKEAGGKVLGAVRHPLNNSDFSSFLLQAQGSGAKVIGLANAGGDTINSIKQASEFGITQSGQSLAGLLVFISDVHSLGLKTSQGLVITTAFYWDQNDETRAFSKRFAEKMGGRVPSMTQAGVYSEVAHYLKAVKAAGTDDAKKVADQMRSMPINDFMTKDGKIREDGRIIRDMYLVQVKKPEESKGPYDYYKILRTIPGEQAYRPLDKGDCPLVKK
ncbi:ABC transporter substrate-binding protein [Constrictibacter sp. MBR-5]|jgi:branched-chain amino acid transport system substrate-binding protein|uniref:ABC transporter substrate-binding protein n=1 Tax=Constrictibacter sp. MBR-5 TaxID=3156467 RepID=UPI0033993EEC